MSSDVAIELFNKGKIATISDVSFIVKPQDILNNPPYQEKTAVTFCFVFNVSKGPLKNKEVRKAIAMSINREELSKLMLRDGAIATGLIPRGFRGYKKREYDFNPSLGKKIIENTLSSKNRKLSLVVGRKKYKYLEHYFKKYLASIGIELTVKYDSFKNSLRDFRKNKYDIIIKGDGPQLYDPSTVFLPYISGQFVNVSNFSHKEVDSIYQEYQRSRNEQDKIAMLEKMENILKEEAPFVPFFHPIFRVWSRPNINTKDKNKFSIKLWEFPLP